MSKNPYQILHLEEDASYDEIKERYRHLTRSLHPDKQPLQNYQATKKLFEEIDEAYKSISSPLRRFLFREYGLPALKILEEVPDYFEQFDLEEVTGQNAKKLHQLMVFLIYEKEAAMQSDKTKFLTKMVVNISKTLKGKPKKARKNAKRNYILPEIQNCTFEHELILPQLFGFANSLGISHTAANMKNDPKQTLGFSTSSARRLYYNYMVSIQSSFSNQQTNFGAGIDRIYQNNMTLNFTPLSVTNWKFNAPRIGIEKAFQDYQISASAALNGFVSIDYTESMSKKIGKSMKFMVERGSIGLIPKVEMQVTDTIRMFVQISANIEDMGKQGIKLQPSFVYGYRMTINEDLKLELSSCLGTPNYFQLSLINTKFRIGIPFIAADVSFAYFQTIKVSVMILAFLMVEGWKIKVKKDKKRREKLIRDNQFRLGETKRDLNRKLADVQMIAHEYREKQIKQNGLIIVKAYFGNSLKINAMMKKLKTLQRKVEPQLLQRQIADLQQSILNFEFQVGNVRDEVDNITGLIQSEVIGGQLRNLDLSKLKPFSPIIDQEQVPKIVILYIERGVVKCNLSSCNEKLNLGRIKQSFSFKKLVRGILQYLS